MDAEFQQHVLAAPERCWSSIGVHGDASCPLLVKHVHCRNCEVFSAAAVQLLDREAPAGQVAEWSRLVAMIKPAAPHDTGSVVIFRVGVEWLALPTTVFEEIVGPRPLHSLPHRRGGAVLGIANVRGELLVCMSLLHILGIEENEAVSAKPRAAGGRLMVLALAGNRIVCPVDEVQGVHRYDPRDLQEVPGTLAGSSAGYTRSILRLAQHAVGLLDEQLLFQFFHRSLASATVT